MDMSMPGVMPGSMPGMMPGSIPYAEPMSTYGTSIQQLTNPHNELEKLELALKCQRVGSKNQIIQYAPPLMNDEGINSVISQVHSIVNQVTVMSNIEENHISTLMLKFSDELIKDLMVSVYQYNIDVAHKNAIRTKILGLAQNFAFLCLRRAWKGDDKRFWKGSQQEFRTIIQNEGSKKGILNKLNPFKSN